MIIINYVLIKTFGFDLLNNKIIVNFNTSLTNKNLDYSLYKLLDLSSAINNKVLSLLCKTSSPTFNVESFLIYFDIMKDIQNEKRFQRKFKMSISSYKQTYNI